MFISSQPPESALRLNLGVANLFRALFHPVSAQPAQYPKTPRFLHIRAAFKPPDLIPVYSFLVLFFKTTKDTFESSLKIIYELFYVPES